MSKNKKRFCETCMEDRVDNGYKGKKGWTCDKCIKRKMLLHIESLQEKLGSSLNTLENYKSNYVRVIEEEAHYYNEKITKLKQENKLKDFLINDMKEEIQKLNGIIERYRLLK